MSSFRFGVIMKYTMTAPCDLCPFRNDEKRLYVHPSVLLDMASGEFCCHKTGEAYEDEEVSEIRPTKDSQHCAGALIFCEKTGQPHQMMRIAERLGMYDRRKLDITAPVFSSLQELRRLSRSVDSTTA
jgi:hypothetical protein